MPYETQSMAATEKRAFKKEKISCPTMSDALQEEMDESRIVVNHSIHCPGLMKLLEELKLRVPGATFVPGKISTVNASSERFKLIFQREGELPNNRYKFVARSGHTTQDGDNHKRTT